MTNHYLRSLPLERIMRMRDLIVTKPNGDTEMPRMLAAIDAELAKREQATVAAYVSEGLGE